jgi:hypothetical protein
MATKFVAYYINDKDQIVAVASMGNPVASLTMFEAMNQNAMPSGSDLKSGKETPESVKEKLKKNGGGGRCKRANCCKNKPVEW